MNKYTEILSQLRDCPDCENDMKSNIGVIARRISNEIVFGNLTKAYKIWDDEKKNITSSQASLLRDEIKATVSELDIAKMNLDMQANLK